MNSREFGGVGAWVVAIVAGLGALTTCCQAGANPDPGYAELRRQFENPDHARWGEVPLWWWEGERMTRERVTWQLETLAAKGVKAVCPIQRSPGRCDPQSFDPDWWELLGVVNRECQRLGMTLWAYDQVGYGHYGWLEKAAAKVQDPTTSRVEFQTVDASGGETVRLELPEGTLLGARAYSVVDGQPIDDSSRDIVSAVRGGILEWTPPDGMWKVAVSVAVPTPGFYLSERSADTFIDMLYGGLERVLGEDSMGTSFVGVFQDEHPPTPRDVYTQALAEAFRARFGYGIELAIPALHFDVGPLTPKYRTDYFDAYLAAVEATYWKRVYDWTMSRDLLTSHDNWGRNNIVRQSEGYIDYFRSQRWFSAPGYDDAGQRPIHERNYYDTKIASSIARLYGRQRVWNEAFHSSGWGRTTEQTLSWLTTGMAFGANLYDEHGLYYSTCASTWEHAAPDPHWRQPYWVFYQTFSDWVARTSTLMSQGQHVVDVALHYPVASLLAGEAPGDRGPDYNRYMELSRLIYDAGIDNDVFDDDSLLNGEIGARTVTMGGNGYQAIVFGPETTVRRSVLEKALQLAEAGGTVVFVERLPVATSEGGREDAQLELLLKRLLGDVSIGQSTPVSREFSGGGLCAFLPKGDERLPALISSHITRDFESDESGIYVSHRHVGDAHIYLLQNIRPEPTVLRARFRVDGVPEIWDAFTGGVSPVTSFKREADRTYVEHPLRGNTAHLLVIRPGSAAEGGEGLAARSPTLKPISEDWAFSVIPTRDNRWGEFRWPPSGEVIGPEVRQFRYREERGNTEAVSRWCRPDWDDSEWGTVLYSSGPYWLVATPSTDNVEAVSETLRHLDQIEPEATLMVAKETLSWEGVAFSKSIGSAQAAPWGGHSGYPDGHIDRNFMHLPEGRKLLFTRLHSPRSQRLGLRIELRNSETRLWVNGAEQPVEDAVGNLPLKRGVNTVLLDLPDGGHGRLYVQRTPPSVSTMAEAAEGSLQPDLERATWIWSGNSVACYVRRTFQLAETPREARLAVSAYSGYRLFVNGVKIEEEIGPWSNWKQPETFSVASHLKPGTNVVAVWGQLFAGQNVNKGSDALRSRGIVLALRTRDAGGREMDLVSDGAWKGATDEVDRWEAPDFNDSAWPGVTVCGRMGDPPWGREVIDNVGAVTEPRRPLSIHLDSPYLECFDEVADVVYDVKWSEDPRVGWYRFDVPPGLKELDLRTKANARVWVDGVEAEVREWVAQIASVPAGVAKVAVRVEMKPGAYAGAAFPLPIGLTLAGGKIQTGLWSEYALPTYSGIGVYSQRLSFSAAELERRVRLDLGQVLVAAEVRVNGRTAGVRLARPFEFDLKDLLQEGVNSIEVRVANTIAPHYTTIPAMNLGPTDSGLIGPVSLRLE